MYNEWGIQLAACRHSQNVPSSKTEIMAKQRERERERERRILIHLVYVMQKCAYREFETVFMYII